MPLGTGRLPRRHLHSFSRWPRRWPGCSVPRHSRERDPGPAGIGQSPRPTLRGRPARRETVVGRGIMRTLRDDILPKQQFVAVIVVSLPGEDGQRKSGSAQQATANRRRPRAGKSQGLGAPYTPHTTATAMAANGKYMRARMPGRPAA